MCLHRLDTEALLALVIASLAHVLGEKKKGVAMLQPNCVWDSLKMLSTNNT